MEFDLPEACFAIGAGCIVLGGLTLSAPIIGLPLLGVGAILIFAAFKLAKNK